MVMWERLGSDWVSCAACRVAAAPGALDLRISDEKSQIGVATRLDAERDALRPRGLRIRIHAHARTAVRT